MHHIVQNEKEVKISSQTWIQARGVSEPPSPAHQPLGRVTSVHDVTETGGFVGRAGYPVFVWQVAPGPPPR